MVEDGLRSINMGGPSIWEVIPGTLFLVLTGKTGLGKQPGIILLIIGMLNLRVTPIIICIYQSVYI